MVKSESRIDQARFGAMALVVKEFCAKFVVKNRKE
jgi:hypothetical protein